MISKYLLTRFFTFILLMLLFPFHSSAQLKRTRAVQNAPVELTFMAPKHLHLYTTEHLHKGELHYSIMHTFGEVNAGVDNFWGLDFGANIRLNFEYGLTDKLTVGVGRTGQDKVYTISARRLLIREKQQRGAPVSISLNMLAGISTIRTQFLANGYTFGDRLHYSASLPFTKKVTNRLSVLVSPMVTHFSRTGTELSLSHPDIQTYLSAGNGFRYQISAHGAITFQSVIPLKDTDQLKPNFGIGFDIETGGHVFQMYFTTSQSLSEAYLVASENGNIFEKAFRFGFNINRLFRLH